MSQSVVDRWSVHDVFNSRPPGSRQWTVFVLCFLVTALEGFDTTIVGFIAPAITAQWKLPGSEVGPLVGMGLVGVLLGSIAGGMLADRMGRRVIGIVAVAWFGVASLASSQADTVVHLVLWRFATGIGIGAAMPVMSALVAEYCSDKLRAAMLAATFCGFLLGAASAGFATAALIRGIGWHGMLRLSGVMPLFVLIAFIWRVPESPRHMLVRGRPAERIRRAMVAIFPGLDPDRLVFDVDQIEAAHSRDRLGLFANDLRTGTLMIWVAEFCGYFVFFLVGSWLPTYLKQTGLPIVAASRLSSIFQFGALGGAIVFAWAVRRVNIATIVAGAFAAGAVLIVALGVFEGVPGYRAIVFLSGMTVGGPLICINTIAGVFYPTPLRASGGGWTLAIGRLGSIAGSLLVGAIVSLHATFTSVCVTLGAPLLIACAAMFRMRAELRREVGAMVASGTSSHGAQGGVPVHGNEYH
jgi:AAHS family 4-hydroxybenzoate transporter-like MFS transporter